MNARCAHCGAAVSPSVHRSIAHCASCRGTSILWPGGSAALSIAKVAANVADERAKQALDALVREAERSAEVRARVEQALERMTLLRKRVVPATGAGDPAGVRALEAELSV
jgi:hypothetical protein